MARRRALLTDSERELIADEDPDDPNRRYQAVSRVRRKIDGELPQDAELLREHHPQLFGELQEVVCGEREDITALRDQTADLRTERDRLQDALAECRSERDDLQAALEDCREQLAAADGADHEAIRRAAADIEAALERADGQAIETAVDQIRAALEGSDGE
jgi:chromosome segregation ATPase